MEYWDAYDKNGNKLYFDLIRGEPIPVNVYHLFPRAMSQAAVLARTVGECREGQIPRCSAALQD